jgi:hypothetical protein
MSRPGLPVFAVGLVCALVACGDNDSPAMPDAPPIAIDAAIDAPACAAPTKMCGATCLDVSEDEENCGECGVECKGGEACQLTCMCAPASFIPATIEPSTFDRFQPAGGITLAIGPTFGNGEINPIIFGYTTTTPLNTDIDLSTIALGETPFVAASYGFDISSMTTDAAYVATAGTLRLTRACGTEAEGTLTGATFQGTTGGLTNPMIDPLGCTITVPTITFHISTAACP